MKTKRILLFKLQNFENSELNAARRWRIAGVEGGLSCLNQFTCPHHPHRRSNGFLQRKYCPKQAVRLHVQEIRAG